MTTVTPAGAITTPAENGWRGSFRSMASPIDVTIGPGCSDPDAAFRTIAATFTDVQTQCTRFDPDSDLMRANRSGDWTVVGHYCLEALRAAAGAHLAAGGRFDPRVLRALLRLGYTHSHESGRSGGPVPARHAVDSREPWLPEIDEAAGRVRVGPDPVDLGGIGKGLAARWAADLVAAECPSLLIDAGGDCVTRGRSPDGGPWRLGVENPCGGEDPLAVFALVDRACATSSVRRCRWQHDGEIVHHLLDPRTGRPGGAGLLAVTVVDHDPADAEIWSKTLFLAGADGVAALAADRGLPALWVFESGEFAYSDALRPFLIWSAPPPDTP